MKHSTNIHLRKPTAVIRGGGVVDGGQRGPGPGVFEMESESEKEASE